MDSPIAVKQPTTPATPLTLALCVLLSGLAGCLEPSVPREGFGLVIQNNTDLFLQIYTFEDEGGTQKWTTHAGPWSPRNVGETGSQYCAVPPLRVRVMEILEHDNATGYTVEGGVFAQGQWPGVSCGGYRLVIQPDHRLELFECLILGRPCDKPVPGG